MLCMLCIKSCNWLSIEINKMDKNKRKNQFQIRKIPFRRNLPEKTPELYALDVHSICLPSRSRKGINYGSLHSDNHYEEDFNPQVIYSPAYQQLYSQYIALREKHVQQRSVVQQEIEKLQVSVNAEEDGKRRLQSLRQGLYSQIEQLREGLNEVRDKNYNLRWEIYHQRGAHYMNVNGYSFLHGGELSYEELLQMQQQMGSIPKGLTEQQISTLPVNAYHSPDGNYQVCCICFDEMKAGDEIFSIKCRHWQHRQCLRDWLLKQRVCPICKQEVVPE